ncbi:MAG: hypothetical protein RJQ09_03565, partial [Cyclobacteriaceae bacterium]
SLIPLKATAKVDDQFLLNNLSTKVFLTLKPPFILSPTLLHFEGFKTKRFLPFQLPFGLLAVGLLGIEDWVVGDGYWGLGLLGMGVVRLLGCWGLGYWVVGDWGVRC